MEGCDTPTEYLDLASGERFHIQDTFLKTSSIGKAKSWTQGYMQWCDQTTPRSETTNTSCVSKSVDTTKCEDTMSLVSQVNDTESTAIHHYIFKSL